MGVEQPAEGYFHQTFITAVACGAFLPIESKVVGKTGDFDAPLTVEQEKGASKTLTWK